jgi:hypothetical protein
MDMFSGFIFYTTTIQAKQRTLAEFSFWRCETIFATQHVRHVERTESELQGFKIAQVKSVPNRRYRRNKHL